MKNIILIITTALITCSITIGQEVIQKKYYKKLYDSTEVPENKGKIVELTKKNSDGTVQYELREIKNDKLLRLKQYKDGNPFGKWIFNFENDSYFELFYNDAEYDSLPLFDVREKKLKGEVEGKFEEPIFPEYENNFPQYVAMNLKYPFIAVEKGIQGKVITQFIIDETGKIVNLSILSSVDIELDKEAARVILQSPKWTPAKINGEPIKVHVIMPTVFVLK